MNTPLRTVRHAGVGFKPEHLPEILAERPSVALFEVHAENYMGAGGPPHRALTAIRDHYPLSIHGVGLSLGGAGDPDPLHLKRLAELVDRYEPLLVSEHLAWSGSEAGFLNDLLPVPYTRNALDRVIANVEQTQAALKRTILIENPSTYLDFEESAFAETDFISELARRTGCGLLLDVNNVFVSCTNRGSEPEEYLSHFPMRFVGEIHLAGHSCRRDSNDIPFLVDSHDEPISEAVWTLFERVAERIGPMPSVIERDANIPAWGELYGEVLRAEQRMAFLADGGRHVLTC